MKVLYTIAYWQNATLVYTLCHGKAEKDKILNILKEKGYSIEYVCRNETKYNSFKEV